jgi:hypothetical protein
MFPLPARITTRMRMRPIGLDVLQELVDAGKLDPALLDEMPTFTMHGTVVEWTLAEHGYAAAQTPEPLPLDCPRRLPLPARPRCQ